MGSRRDAGVVGHHYRPWSLLFAEDPQPVRQQSLIRKISSSRPARPTATMDVIPGVLQEVGKLCLKMKENEELCRSLHARMTLFWEHLTQLTTEERMAKESLLFKYHILVTKILEALQKHSKKHLFIRVWSNSKVVAEIQKFFEGMDDLFKLMGIEHMEAMAELRPMIERGFQKLQEVVADPKVIRIELKAENWQEGVVLMGFQLQHESKSETDSHSVEQLELIRQTFHRAESILAEENVPMPLIPEWFIPRDDVDFDNEDFFDSGAYATAHLGTWGKDAARGHGTKLVIKCLRADEEQAKKEFNRECKAWFGLNHPNVITLYGACHEGMPVFFVCEHAKSGNFVTFLETDKTWLWRLFYQAALGLRYLHEKKVVHGDLKGNNILVDGTTAKICDFGFAYIRSQSVGLSAKAQTDAIRWKAPECLLLGSQEPDPETNPRFASDVFSFGMCIIEAFLGEPPYGLVDDLVIMEKVFKGEEYPRPDGLQDDEWELVERLCDRDWQTRIPLSDALDQLKSFADREEAEKKPRAVDPVEAQVCSKCSANMSIDFTFCGKCGTSLLVAKAV
ncbi:hypothetical protein BBJ28_00016330 [Nothophytophthora sp. Chile5]|nr:hypothetical protein BBJ28_00016330 [Nothophytophthora sp. Chile5]